MKVLPSSLFHFWDAGDDEISVPVRGLEMYSGIEFDPDAPLL